MMIYRLKLLQNYLLSKRKQNYDDELYGNHLEWWMMWIFSKCYSLLYAIVARYLYTCWEWVCWEFENAYHKRFLTKNKTMFFLISLLLFYYSVTLNCYAVFSDFVCAMIHVVFLLYLLASSLILCVFSFSVIAASRKPTKISEIVLVQEIICLETQPTYTHTHSHCTVNVRQNQQKQQIGKNDGNEWRRKKPFENNVRLIWRLYSFDFDGMKSDSLGDYKKYTQTLTYGAFEP